MFAIKPLSQLALKIQPSTTLAIDSMFKQMKAEGQDVVGFGAGEPDFPTPDYIKEAGIEAIRNNDTKYTPSVGTVEVRKAVCQRLKEDCGIEYQPAEIAVSNGAKTCVYACSAGPGQPRGRGHPARALLGELHRAHSDGGRRARGGERL